MKTVKIKKIEHIGVGSAYNITMRKNKNFFLANGILTHNTSDAQSALRRTMEQYTRTCRFILSCNYSSKIIEPIQSRCAVYRFKPISDEAVEVQVRYIANKENLIITEDGIEAIKYITRGDMRKAINALQAAALLNTKIDSSVIYQISATAHPEDITELISYAFNGNFAKAREKLNYLLTQQGLSGEDIVEQIYRAIFDQNIPERTKVYLIDKIGETDFRLTEGANTRIQLEALIAQFVLAGEGLGYEK
ncbi:MAG TPA: hypothetical protein EYP22_06070 [Methanosarcinales archaeon]|nr:hypothetical protein [Methanosarcinales archaeon]